MHECSAYQIKRGHLLHTRDGDVEEVLDVEEFHDGDDRPWMYVATRNVTSLSPHEHTFRRHEDVVVE